MSVLLVFVLKFTRHVVTSGCPMEFVPVTKWYWWNWLVFVLKFTRHVVTSGCPMEFVPVTKWYWWNWFYIYGFYTLVFNLFSVSLFIQHSSCCRSLAAQWSLFRQPELLFCWHFVSWLLYWDLTPYCTLLLLPGNCSGNQMVLMELISVCIEIYSSCCYLWLPNGICSGNQIVLMELILHLWVLHFGV